MRQNIILNIDFLENDGTVNVLSKQRKPKGNKISKIKALNKNFQI